MADSDIHEDILSRLRAAGSAESAARAAADGFEHLFKHIRKQEERIAALEQKTSKIRVVDGKTFMG